MNTIKRTLLAIILFATLGLLAFAGLVAWRVQPRLLELAIKTGIERMTDGEVQFRRAHFLRFPAPEMELGDMTISLKKSGVLFKAESVKLHFRMLALLMGRTEIVRVKVSRGRLSVPVPSMDHRDPVKKMTLSNLFLKVDSVRTGGAMKLQFSGDLESVPKTLEGEGQVVIQPVKPWDGATASWDGVFKLKDFPFKDLGNRMLGDSSLKIKNGTVSAEFQIKKPAGDLKSQITGKFGAKKFIYEVPKEASSIMSPAIDADFQFDTIWDAGQKQLVMKPSTLVSPLGKMELTGQAFPEKGEIRELNMRASGIALESIPYYILPLKEAIPFNIGFSGPSNLEMSVQGTLAQLSLHANWDLGPALLTYARYFSKPKEVPMNLTFDYVLHDGKILGGDFSARLLETTFKGSLTDLNFETGAGSANVITNKFKLDGWQAVVPPLQGYKLGGEIKVLANWAGNFRKPEETKNMWNVTVEKGDLIAQSGVGIRNADLSVDYGPVALDFKQIQLDIGDATIAGQVAIYNFPQNPLVKGKISSSQLKPLTVLAQAKELLGSSFAPEWQAGYDAAKNAVAQFFPPEETVDNFSTEIQYENKKWTVANFNLEAYSGTTIGHASFDYSQDHVPYEVDMEINRLSLAKFLSRGGAGQKIIDGNLFLKAAVTGEQPGKTDWEKKNAGKGSFSITNGEYYTVDLLSTIGKIGKLDKAAEFATGTTPFDDIHSDFKIVEGKIETEKLVFVSRDVTMQGDGEIGFDGVLNYRLSAFLSPSLTDKVIAPLLGKTQVDGEQQFGSIPLLLSGPVAKPELKPDAALVPQLLDQLSKKRTQKIFRNFLPEEFLFDRRKSS